MRVPARARLGVLLVFLIAGMTLGTAAAWASEGAATDAVPEDDSTVAPASEAGADSADAPGALFLVEGAWFVLEVRPGQMLLTVKSDTDGQADVVFEIPALRTRNHGGYVSALATALEPGPRRGQIVSALARSSVGKPDKSEKSEKSDKVHKADRQDKAEKADKPDGSDAPDDIGEADGDETELGEDSDEGDEGDEGKALGKNKSSGKDKAPGNERSSDKARGNSRGH